MAYRTVCIQTPCELSLSNSRLILKREGENPVAIPISDLWVLILESHLIKVTVALLSELNAKGVGVMVCGRDHMPNGLCLPIGAHSRHAAIVEHQLLMSAPLKKRLWQRIIRQKIINQAECLERNGRAAEKLVRYAESVKSNDSGGMESAAASEYFRAIIPEGTRRDGPYAGPLDYGYAILRASIGRTCVAGGWLVSRGIRHCSDLNAFNLVDDLIEPFRPFVDDIVFADDIREPLTSKSKLALISLLEKKVEMNGELVMVQYACELMLDSFRRAVLQNDATQLVLPEFPKGG